MDPITLSLLIGCGGYIAARAIGGLAASATGSKGFGTFCKYTADIGLFAYMTVTFLGIPLFGAAAVAAPASTGIAAAIKGALSSVISYVEPTAFHMIGEALQFVLATTIGGCVTSLVKWKAGDGSEKAGGGLGDAIVDLYHTTKHTVHKIFHHHHHENASEKHHDALDSHDSYDQKHHSDPKHHDALDSHAKKHQDQKYHAKHHKDSTHHKDKTTDNHHTQKHDAVTNEEKMKIEKDLAEIVKVISAQNQKAEVPLKAQSQELAAAKEQSSVTKLLKYGMKHPENVAEDVFRVATKGIVPDKVAFAVGENIIKPFAEAKAKYVWTPLVEKAEEHDLSKLANALKWIRKIDSHPPFTSKENSKEYTELKAELSKDHEVLGKALELGINLAASKVSAGNITSAKSITEELKDTIKTSVKDSAKNSIKAKLHLDTTNTNHSDASSTTENKTNSTTENETNHHNAELREKELILSSLQKILGSVQDTTAEQQNFFDQYLEHSKTLDLQELTAKLQQDASILEKMLAAKGIAVEGVEETAGVIDKEIAANGNALSSTENTETESEAEHLVSLIMPSTCSAQALAEHRANASNTESELEGLDDEVQNHEMVG